MSEMMSNPSQIIGLLIDIAVIAGLFVLWLTWYKNGNRQKKLEHLLAETAQQLEEASLHLNQATQVIEQLKDREAQNETVSAAEPVNLKSVQNIPEPPVQASQLPPESSTQATMVLRMHREGENAESIADRLNIPLAQVKLLLKLYASKSAA